jgi:hypothetical protein
MVSFDSAATLWLMKIRDLGRGSEFRLLAASADAQPVAVNGSASAGCVIESGPSGGLLVDPCSFGPGSTLSSFTD